MNPSRAERRNAAKGTVWRGTDAFAARPSDKKLNRSAKHPFAMRYEQARAMARHNGAEVKRESVV